MPQRGRKEAPHARGETGDPVRVYVPASESIETAIVLSTTAEIIHSNAGGEMNVRNAKGRKIVTAHPEAYLSHFSLCRWPASFTSPNLLYTEDDAIWFYDTGGKQHDKYPAPYAGSLASSSSDAHGVPVTLRANTPSYLAVAVTYSHDRKSALYLYDTTGELKYQEVLDEPCEAIAAVPSGNGKTETLLLGCDCRVLQYSMPEQ